MGILVDALDSGFVVIKSDTCRSRPGMVLEARVGDCPCEHAQSGCPVVAEMDRVRGSGIYRALGARGEVLCDG